MLFGMHIIINGAFVNGLWNYSATSLSTLPYYETTTIDNSCYQYDGKSKIYLYQSESSVWTMSPVLDSADESIFVGICESNQRTITC